MWADGQPSLSITRPPLSRRLNLLLCYTLVITGPPSGRCADSQRRSSRGSTQPHAWTHQIHKQGYTWRDFPGGPVAKTLLPIQGAWVPSLVRELDPTCPNYKESICCSEDQRSYVPQLRCSAAKEINIKKKKERKGNTCAHLFLPIIYTVWISLPNYPESTAPTSHHFIDNK